MRALQTGSGTLNRFAFVACLPAKQVGHDPVTPGCVRRVLYFFCSCVNGPPATTRLKVWKNWPFSRAKCRKGHFPGKALQPRKHAAVPQSGAFAGFVFNRQAIKA
jgi:hypothetical protein